MARVSTVFGSNMRGRSGIKGLYTQQLHMELKMKNERYC